MNINIFRPIFEALGLPYVGPYMTLLALSAVAGLPIVWLLSRRFGLSPRRTAPLWVATAAAGLIGSKIFHVLFDERLGQYLGILNQRGPLAFIVTGLNPFKGGHVFYGGLAGAFLLGLWIVRGLYRENVRTTLRYYDLFVIPTALGLVLSRIGCFLAGCCFGLPSDIFGVSFPPFSIAAHELYSQGITDSFLEATPPLIPTQLLEAVASLALFVHLLLLSKKALALPPGTVLTRFLSLYAVARFLIEFLRADIRGGFLFLSTGQWMSLAILAVLWVVRWRARGRTGLKGPTGLTIIAGAMVFFSTTAWALPPEKKLHHYVARHWSAKEGLPHNTITAIARTPDGLVWLATAEGLVRFDGGAFFSFGAEYMTGAAGLRFSGLTLERNGDLWAGTETGDIVRHHKGSFSLFGRTRGLPESPVQALSAAPEGIYAIVGQRLFRITGDTVAESDGAGNASLLTADPSGRVIALSGAQMHFPDAARKETLTFSQLTGKNPSALLFDGGGALYIGTVTGEIIRLKDIDDTTGELLRRADGIPISAFAADGPVVWAGTQGKGLLRIARTGAVEVFDDRHGLSGTIIRALHRDHDGNLWVATEQGLDLFSDGVAVTLTTLDGLSSNLVYALLEDRDGALWIGTRGGGLNRYANGKFTALTVKNGLPSDLIGGLALDDDGTLWIGSTGGLTALRDGKATVYTTRNGLAQNITGAILRDRDRNLWVGTLGGDINLFQGKKPFRVFPSQRIPAPELVSQIYEDRSGRRWVAAQYGLSLFNKGFIKTYTAKEGLSSTVILALHEDDDMNLWIGTHRGGLNLHREGRFAALSARNGLPAEDVYAILIDDTDRLWLSTDNGIIYLPRKALLSYLDDGAALPAIGRIGLSDGMRTLECTGGVQPAALKATNGTLYFPTVKGLVLIDPRTVPAAPEVPNTYFAALTVGDRRIVPGDELTLPAKRHEFSVEFGAVALRHDRPFTFRYKLEGIDPDWRESPDGRATYRDLPPGDYPLLATVLTSAGTPGTAVRLDLHIPDDRWPLLLSIGIPALLLLLAIVLFLRRRKVEKPLPKPLELLPEEPQRNEKSDTAPAPATAAAVIEEPSPAAQPAEPAARQRYEKSRLDDDTARTIVTMILKYMEEKKSYKDPDITLAGLADKLELSPHLLSQLLNDRLSRNFNAFINEYRVAEVKTMLEDPANRDKLLAIAYDAGFRSKTTFNTIFKKCTGKTPREYRKNLDGGEFLDSDEMPD